MNHRLLLPLSFFCISSLSFSQPDVIPSFPLHPNDLELTRLAQPLQYFDKIGKRAGIMGYESGTFEAWVWPWKPLRNFELSFLLGTSTQPILAKDIIRTISVIPEATVLTYTYESFTVKEIIVVPRDEPGAILLLDVYSTTPLTIIAGFLPVMQPMWPAGVGGQFSYWDDDAHAYVISEGQWRAMFLCGSPLAQQMAAPPAHMFADNPLQFKIDVKPGESAGKFIPIIIAGGSKAKMDSVKSTYNRLWTNAERYYQENYDYYQNLRNSTMHVITPDKEFNLAYEWGKVALDNLMITNPTLGTGMVAGFGLSGGGARPGFAWFFGGDAFINSLAMNGYGDYSKVRDALAFTQKWQRQEDFPIRKKNPSDPPKDVGKMAHELSQSDGICDWWNDYRYAYNHADTTPWYLVTMGDYVRTSGDVEFLRKSWTSVKQAYEWCLSKDSDGDGLMDLKGAGLGALEFGKLVGIYADVYTCGVWVQGVKEMKYMAGLVGDSVITAQADAQFKKAQSQLERKFWMEKEGLYTYGATEKGEQVHEKTPWSGVAMMFGLLDEERTSRSIESLNSADICTDWGVRSLSNKSELFEPTNYNYGAVWPFISSFFNTAQFKHHYSLPAYQLLQSNFHHAFDHALGTVPEVFSGELNEKLGEAYHHQGFSTTGYMLPLLRGLLGLEVDGATRTIRFSPHISTSSVRSCMISNLRLGRDTLGINFENSNHGTISLAVTKKGPDTVRIEFSPCLSLGAEPTLVYSVPRYPKILPDTTRIRVPFEIVKHAEDSHVITKFSVWDSYSQGIKYRSVGYLALPELNPYRNDPNVTGQKSIGNSNRGLKIISQKQEGNKLTLTVEGLSGASYDLGLLYPADAIIEGATRGSGTHVVSFDHQLKQEFVRKEITITLK